MGEKLTYTEVYQVKPGEITNLIINFLEARGIDAEVVRDRVVSIRRSKGPHAYLGDWWI
jgi:hypothetical protein